MTSLQQLVNALVSLANTLIPLLLAIAVIAFIWGIIQFLWLRPDSQEERTRMKNFMLMGVIAITVILSIWGLATMLKNSLFPSAPCPIGVSGCGSSLSSSNSSAAPSYYTGTQINQMSNATAPSPTGSGLTFPSASGN